MGFRSEEEALRAKNEALEDDLAETRRELDAARPRLERMEALERELTEARAELAKRTAKKKPRRLVRWLVGGAAAAVLLTGISGVVAVHKAQRAENLRIEEQDRARRREEQAARAARQEREAREAAFAAEAARRAAEEQDTAPTPPPEPYLVRDGRVVSVEGPAPTVDGAECTLTLERAPGSSLDARLHVSCGNRTVYGEPRFGYVPCTFEGEQPSRCEDRTGSADRGDPMVVLDLPTDTAVVSDGPEMPWTVRIELE